MVRKSPDPTPSIWEIASGKAGTVSTKEIQLGFLFDSLVAVLPLDPRGQFPDDFEPKSALMAAAWRLEDPGNVYFRDTAKAFAKRDADAFRLLQESVATAISVELSTGALAATGLQIFVPANGAILRQDDIASWLFWPSQNYLSDNKHLSYRPAIDWRSSVLHCRFNIESQSEATTYSRFDERPHVQFSNVCVRRAEVERLWPQLKAHFKIYGFSEKLSRSRHAPKIIAIYDALLADKKINQTTPVKVRDDLIIKELQKEGQTTTDDTIRNALRSRE